MLHFHTFVFQIPYARSQTHLMEVSETVCKDNFEEYAQAKWKKSGKPTIIRLQTHTGNMNPDMGKVDIVPDDDLNKSLKFHVSVYISIFFPVRFVLKYFWYILLV